MKVTLINPPSPYLENDAAYPPTGLLYLGAAVRELGHEPVVVDLAGDGDWRKTASSLESDAFGITCVTPNFKIVQELAALLPSKAPVVIGGPHATFLPDDVLNNVRCDVVVMGEGEDAIARVLSDIQSGGVPYEVVYYGDVFHVPKPARDLVNLSRYHNPAVVYTSRGCPFHCAFCSKVTGRRFTLFPIGRVIEEVTELREMGFDHIIFGDDNIAIRDDLPQLLLSLLPLNISFRLNQDTRHISLNTSTTAAAAGCTEVSFGVESGSQTILNVMNKHVTVGENCRAIAILKDCGIKVKVYLVVNFPGETEETVEETVRFIEETRPDEWLLSSFAPLPGCDVFNNPGKYGVVWMSSNWEDYYLVGKGGGFTPSFATAELTPDRQVYLHDLLYMNLKEISS